MRESFSQGVSYRAMACVVRRRFGILSLANDVMTANKTTTMPEMELRETLRRFGWLMGILSVIWLVTVAVQAPASHLIEQRRESIRPGLPIEAMLAGR